MRGHPLVSPAPCAFITYPVRLIFACLVGSLPSPLLVPCSVASCLHSCLASRSSCRRAYRSSHVPLRPSSSASCLLSLGSSSPWLSPRIVSRLAPLLPAHRPADRVEKRGGLRLACRHVVKRAGANGCLSLSRADFLCLIGVAPFLFKNSPR